MTLIEVIRDLQSFDAEDTIYAAQPWQPSSVAVVAHEQAAGKLPHEAGKLGLNYFLEIFVARDFIEGWVSNIGSEPSLEQKCTRLIQYATTDA